MKVNDTWRLFAIILACVFLFSACQHMPSRNSSVYFKITLSKETTITTAAVVSATTSNTTTSAKKVLNTTPNHKHLRSIYFKSTKEYTTAFSDMYSFADICQLFNERTTSSRFNEENFEMMLEDRFFLLPVAQEAYPYRLDDFSIQFFMGGGISFPLKCPHGKHLSISYSCKKGDPYEGQKFEDYLVNKAGQAVRKVHIGSYPRYIWDVDGYQCEMNWLSSSDVCSEECTRNFFETVLFEKIHIDRSENKTNLTTMTVA